MSYFTKTAMAGALAVTLAACGSEAEEPVVDNDLASEQVVGTPEYDPMTRDYNLSEQAQERRAGFDADAFQSEYAGYRDEIVNEPNDEGTIESEGTTSITTGSDGETSVTNDGEEVQPIGPRDVTTNMRARRDMSWGYLDRNDDNRLSVAEYAIWAIPLDPEAPARNDETAPFLTAEQANKAADSFFYYDLDGDTYLDRREFTAARRGENFDS